MTTVINDLFITIRKNEYKKLTQMIKYLFHLKH